MSIGIATTALSRRANGRLSCLIAAALLSALSAAGCCTTKVYAPDRLECGYTVVLHGIIGNKAFEPSIIEGLTKADVPSAIEMYDWTNGSPNLIYNLRGLEHNRREAKRLAEKIIAYQDQYPGRPVYLIGYSGGAGLAVMALEELPPNRKITGAVLLAPALSPDYDLRLALSRTESGIHNFYSPYDVPIMMVLSTAFGTMEGRHTIGAGGVGFKTPADLTGEDRKRYEEMLVQHAYTFDMAAEGHLSDHFGWTKSGFIRRWVAPLVTSQSAQQGRIALLPNVLDVAAPR
jgi:pimeloyl-ACP methyl ester carboxylesterase